jgi:hypothetical protein
MPFQLLFNITTCEKPGYSLPNLPDAINHPAVYILQ